MKALFRLGTVIIVAFTLFCTRVEPERPWLGGGIANVEAAGLDRLKIPAIKVNLRIVTARFRGDTWDFSQISYQAAYLEGRPKPGNGQNVVIGAHSELARRAPGPFFKLDSLQPGDEIIVTHAGVDYHYRVQSKWTVAPTDLSPIVQTDTEVLTLLTCEGYSSQTHQYDLRLIVRAIPIPPPVSAKNPPEH